ncbi:hypothetical protein FRC06_006749 [Ceratobasidium sp. 370]|nr:hypothetical protein FRC06_006749 [Ceratobasidium sp. 370]
MNSAAILLSLFLLASSVHAQQVGTQTAEVHLALTWQKCTKSGGWSPNRLARSSSTSTGVGSTPPAVTPTATPATGGILLSVPTPLLAPPTRITTSGNALTLKFITTNLNGKNVGTRVYLLADDSTCQMFKVKNQEFTFDVDVSNLPCGLNGALYLSEMSADGGLFTYSGNKAGAKYGTGYCDAQCPKDIKFINGEANVIGWTPSSNDANSRWDWLHRADYLRVAFYSRVQQHLLLSVLVNWDKPVLAECFTGLLNQFFP